MKGEIHCPYCGKMLGKYEDVRGSGSLYLFCKRCGKERYVAIRLLSVER